MGRFLGGPQGQGRRHRRLARPARPCRAAVRLHAGDLGRVSRTSSSCRRREGRDDSERTRIITDRLLADHPDLVGLYSLGAGNRGIAAALEAAGRAQQIVYIAHELTPHTRRFLVRGIMDAAINQDRRPRGALGRARAAGPLLRRADGARPGAHPHRHLHPGQHALTAPATARRGGGREQTDDQGGNRGGKQHQGPGDLPRPVRGRRAPFNSWDSICKWAAGARLQGRADPDLGRPAVRPREGGGIEDLLRRDQGHGGASTASRSPSSRPTCRASSSRCIPAYDEAFDAFAPPQVHGNPKARQEWAVEQMHAGRQGLRAISASTAHVTFSGALAWPFLYPWPQRPAGLIETAFDELARRWRPILDAFDEAGVDVCYEIHPGEDLLRRRDLRDVPRPS